MNKHQLVAKERRKWTSFITLEPTAFLYTLSYTLSDSLLLNLNLDKACLRYDPSSIINSSQQCADESAAEIKIANLNTLCTIFYLLFCVISTTFAGPFVDKYPKLRKNILFLPIVGQIMVDITNYTCVYFWNWDPSITIIYFPVISGFSGSLILFNMMSVSYLSYLSDTQGRTNRIGYFYIVNAFASGFGSAVAGYIQTYLGYYTGFEICVVLSFLAIISAIILIVDTRSEIQEKESINGVLSAILQNFEVLTRPRQYTKHVLIWLALFTYPLLYAVQLGESILKYLYLRHQFQWTAVEYGVYSAFKMFVTCFGTFICVEILNRMLHFYDSTIGLVSCFFQMLGAIMWVMISCSWEVYAVTVVGMFEKGVLAVVISLASKCVEPHEYGKLSSLFGITTAISPSATPLYTAVYQETINILPGAIFLISFALLAPAFIIFCVMRYLSQSSTNSTELSYESI